MNVSHRDRPICSVLVPSCDAYADLWTPFLTLFWRYWPDCPFPVHLGSNDLSFDDPRVMVVHAGHGRNFTNRVREQIESLSTPFVLLMLEDFFLRRMVNTQAVLDGLDALRRLDGEVLRLVPRPKPDSPVRGYATLGRITPGAPYRVSTQAAIWKRETLLALMREGESIWEFELQGTVRSMERSEGFYGVWQPLLPYGHHVVERGKWFPWDAWRFGRMDIGCDFQRRGIMTVGETLQWTIRKTVAMVLGLIPWKQRESVLRVLRRLPLRAASRS